jgi:hypothetical protein
MYLTPAWLLGLSSKASRNLSEFVLKCKTLSYCLNSLNYHVLKLWKTDFLYREKPISYLVLSLTVTGYSISLELSPGTFLPLVFCLPFSLFCASPGGQVLWIRLPSCFPRIWFLLIFSGEPQGSQLLSFMCHSPWSAWGRSPAWSPLLAWAPPVNLAFDSSSFH